MGQESVYKSLLAGPKLVPPAPTIQNSFLIKRPVSHIALFLMTKRSRLKDTLSQGSLDSLGQIGFFPAISLG